MVHRSSESHGPLYYRTDCGCLESLHEIEPYAKFTRTFTRLQHYGHLNKILPRTEGKWNKRPSSLALCLSRGMGAVQFVWRSSFIHKTASKSPKNGWRQGAISYAEIPAEASDNSTVDIRDQDMFGLIQRAIRQTTTSLVIALGLTWVSIIRCGWFQLKDKNLRFNCVSSLF